MNWPIAINTGELPPTENQLRRTYRHPHAYRELREHWIKILQFGSGSAKASRLIREAAARGPMRVKILIFKRRFHDQDNADGCRKFILDAARNKKVRFLTDDNTKWLASAIVVQMKSKTRGTVITFEPDKT